jgi:hypothetical protein
MKYSLNNDGQQFYQNQENEQPSLISNSKTKINHDTPKSKK